ncbi:metal ABC transporter solute-binding protein, Zn/Mn family [Thermococcus alcaliphilus]|uniref:metal ABC transporter solute-binding protein, Zn/Mn family n=1 Tax=Thermococcus alcaliphilus TaxID=139207 RepID=UPI00209101DC|nr:zinc ABC transporter substrate-binding protein [Thermococcus alcaliphilus]MCO6040977.1 zinc ABC transporter substrate-binding protein [Thermococcus alcaliphilus]
MKRMVILFVLILFLAPLTTAQEKPLVVTSIAPIAEILREAFGDTVQVEYLVPLGVDPHQYQLTPDQIEEIQRADVVVTIGHLPAEEKIEELKREGILKGKVLGIEDYQRYGFRYLPERWYNNKYNLHGIWLDPYNALAIAEAVKDALANSPAYTSLDSRFSEFEAKLEGIVLAYQKLGLEGKKALIELPSQQYTLEWMGIIAVDSIKPEEEVPAKSVDELLTVAKTVDVIVYSEESPEPLKSAALELSKRTGIPVVKVSVMWSGRDYTEVLAQNSANIASAFRSYAPEQGQTFQQTNLNTTYILLALVVGITLGTALGVIIKN